MKLRTGFVLGLIIGAVWALLFAPSREDLGEGGAGEPASPAGGRDPLVRLRRALDSLRRQMDEAWREAQEAAREAEEKMRERYRESLRRGRYRQR